MRTTTRSRRRLDRGRRLPSIYSRTEEQAVKQRGKGVYVFLFVALLGALGYFVFISPYFQVKTIVINDLRYLDKANVQKLADDYKNKNILTRNIVTLSSNGLKRELEAGGGIESTKIKKKYPDQIQIILVEKTPILVWETLGKKYLVDEKGRVTGEYEEKFKDLPLVTDTKNVPLTESKQLVSPDFSKFVKDVSKDFNGYTGANIAKIEVPEITTEIKVTSDASWYAQFDTTRTAKNQLVNLSRIIAEAKSKKKKLEYVDLRIDNRIFYK